MSLLHAARRGDSNTIDNDIENLREKMQTELWEAIIRLDPALVPDFGDNDGNDLEWDEYKVFTPAEIADLNNNQILGIIVRKEALLIAIRTVLKVGE